MTTPARPEGCGGTSRCVVRVAPWRCWHDEINASRSLHGLCHRATALLPKRAIPSLLVSARPLHSRTDRTVLPYRTQLRHVRAAPAYLRPCRAPAYGSLGALRWEVASCSGQRLPTVRGEDHSVYLPVAVLCQSHRAGEVSLKCVGPMQSSLSSNGVPCLHRFRTVSCAHSLPWHVTLPHLAHIPSHLLPAIRRDGKQACLWRPAA